MRRGWADMGIPHFPARMELQHSWDFLRRGLGLKGFSPDPKP